MTEKGLFLKESKDKSKNEWQVEQFSDCILTLLADEKVQRVWVELYKHFEEVQVQNRFLKNAELLILQIHFPEFSHLDLGDSHFMHIWLEPCKWENLPTKLQRTVRGWHQAKNAWMAKLVSINAIGYV